MTEPNDDGQSLSVGQTLRRHRLEHGWSLRHTAKALRIGASTLLDYEQDRRLPSEDILQSAERLFGATPEVLTRLRRLALAVRAADALSPRTGDESTSDSSTVEARPQPGTGKTGTPISDQPVLTRPLQQTSSLRRSIGLMLCGAFIALASQDLVLMIMHSDAPVVARRTAAYTQTVAPPLPAAGDDKDPRDSGCDADGTTLGRDDIVVHHPDRIVIGQVIARYSPRCHTLWPRFEPTGALDRLAPHAHISLTATRPTDGRHVQSGGSYLGVFMWGQMLFTSSGCVIASVTVTDPALHAMPTSSTGCLSGADVVR
jgi:transcriptional regulator with XRE-family HTH domain